MKDTVARKKITADKANEISAAEAAAKGSLPNAAVSEMMNKSDKAFVPSGGLGDAVASRLPGRLQNEIPLAENEADSFAAGVAASDAKSVKDELGEKLGADFSSVRFHTGGNAEEYARSVGARAYTTGSDVYFGEGGFDPVVAAHELVHTVQQGAVGSEVQTMSAPTGGIQMWNPFRKKRPPERKPLAYEEQKAPGQLAIGDASKERKILKGSMKGDTAATVEMFQQTNGNGTGVIKTQTDAALEEALSDYYNSAGSVFAADKKEGDWSFDCAAARTLRGDEIEKARGMFQSGQLYDQMATNQNGTVDLDMAVSRTAAYGTVSGKSLDPKVFKGGSAPSEERQGKFYQNVDPESASSYRQMLGYVGALDIIVGNRDRIAGAYNSENWMEERDKKKIHLIDNVYNQSPTALGALDAETMTPAPSNQTLDAWQGAMQNKLSPQGGERRGLGNAVVQAAKQDNMDQYFGADSPMHVYDEGDFTAGGDAAGAHLPQIYSKVAERFAGKTTGELNAYQSEVLERLHRTMLMLNPEAEALAPAQQLAKARSDIERAAYGGQTHGARPTATSGPGWTRGTASDWLGNSAAPSPAATNGPRWVRGTVGNRAGNSAAPRQSAPSSAPTASAGQAPAAQQPAQAQTQWQKGRVKNGFRIPKPGFGFRG